MWLNCKELWGYSVVRDGCGVSSILVAEDDPPNRKVALLMLRRLGYEADAVVDGIEVLQALERRHYDLILMNIGMPKMDGITAAKKIRARWPVAEQPIIIAITAYLLPDGRERCLAAGMNDYIIKPVKMNDLADMLRKHWPKGPIGEETLRKNGG
jgi:CheY-like chemotaxis protein